MPEPGQQLRIDPSRMSRQGRLRLDKLAGSVVIAEKALRRLVIVDSPDLSSLDISGCTDGLQVRIDRMGALRWIRVPEGPAGSVLELRLPERFLAVSPLEIRGSVAEVELKASWLVAPWTPVSELDESPLDGLSIGAPDTAPAEVRADLHLHVGPGAEKDCLELDCEGTRHLVIKGCRARELVLRNADLQTLDIGECRLLESIGGEFRAERMRISVCRALRRVSGSGQTLDIGCLGTANLDIDGEWGSVSICESELQAVNVRSIQKLRLMDLPYLHFLDHEHIGSLDICHNTCDPDRLIAWVEAQRGLLAHWLARGQKATSDSPAPLGPLTVQWIDRAVAEGESSRLAGILAALSGMAGHPDDAAAVWRLRCALLAACISRNDTQVVASLGDTPWFWGIDPRANPAVWLQDLALLHACKEFPAARDTLLSMMRQGRIAPVWALARALSDHADGATERKDLWREWLQGSLEQLDLRAELDAHLVRGVVPKPPPANMGWIGRMAHAAKHKPVSSLLPELARMICKIDPQGMSETLARKMVGQIPDAGDLLIEVGLDFHRAGAAGTRLLLATGLSAAKQVSQAERAEVMAALLATRSSD